MYNFGDMLFLKQIVVDVIHPFLIMFIRNITPALDLQVYIGTGLLTKDFLPQIFLNI